MAEGGGEDKASARAPAVFISYASQDAAAAARICSALRQAGIEVWFDKSELRGGDVWDRSIRQQIRECQLFVPVISAHTDARREGYFRREWKLAVDRTHDMSERVAFLVPVVIDDTSDSRADVPDRFREVQWSRLPGGEASPAFVERVKRLLSPAPATPAPLKEAGSSVAPARREPVRTSSRSSRTGLVVVAVIVAASLGYWAINRFWISKHRASPPVASASPTTTTPATAAAFAPPPHSIAVLPFVDMSEKHDQEYFADGMAEEIIDLLAQVPDLRVPARTSSFYFKGKSTPVPEIALQLGVANVLEGSIRRSGNRIRVTAQLARADNGYHLWSQTYDRDAGDVFKVQDDIANAVVQAMQITLMGGPLTRRRGGTQNLQAYQLYLRGLSSMWQVTDASLASAREYFNQALSLDPDFGLAWAELSRDTLFMVSNGGLPTREGYERARREAQRALQVSADIPEAHGMLANIYRNFDWDWTASDAEVRQALEVDPTNPTALMRGGQLSYTLGHWDDAERQLRLALVRDPLATIAIWSLGTAQYGAGRYAEAEATYRKLLEVAPGFLGARGYLGKTLLAEGKAEAALAMVQQETSGEVRQKYLPIVLRAVDRTADADDALQALVAKSAATDAYYVAMNYAYRGDHDLTFQWLERAYEQRDQGFREIVGEPLFKNVAQDPRFRAFLRKMKLPE